jgi:hydroxypyruvate isomerase
MKLSACIEWLFAAEHADFVERIHASRSAGLAAVEFHLWREKPLAAIRGALDETGLMLTSIVVEPRCRLADPASHAKFHVAVQETLATAEQLGARYIIPSVGLALPEIAPEVQRDCIVRALRDATQLAAGSPVKLLLEPVNSRIDLPGMYLNSTREGLEIIERVGAPNLSLLYDVYHSVTMGEVPEQVLAGQQQRIGYVQAADSPGRHEPGTGEIDWAAFRRLLQTLDYSGLLGLEYHPSADTLTSLQTTRRSLGLSS